MPLFGAIDHPQWVKTQKRNPLNHRCLMNGRLISSHFCTGILTGPREREAPRKSLAHLIDGAVPQELKAF